MTFLALSQKQKTKSLLRRQELQRRERCKQLTRHLKSCRLSVYEQGLLSLLCQSPRRTAIPRGNGTLPQ